MERLALMAYSLDLVSVAVHVRIIPQRKKPMRTFTSDGEYSGRLSVTTDADSMNLDDNIIEKVGFGMLREGAKVSNVSIRASLLSW